MDQDEKDKIIEHLRAELNRHKEMLSEVFEKRNQLRKQSAARGETLSRLHNENQKLRSRIHKLENPISVPARRRWKSREADQVGTG